MKDVGRGGPDQQRSSTVSLVLPCRNEARNLEELLPRIPDWIDDLIIVDSGSVDDTVSVARALRSDAVVVTSPKAGKGAAIAAGFAMAQGDYLVAMDADGSNDPAELPRILAALDDGAEVVRGSRYLPGGGSDDATVMRDFGNSVLRWLFNRLHGAELTDLCYGYVGFRQPHRETLLEGCEGFAVEAVFQANACRAGLHIEEFPSHEAGRVHGQSNLRPVRDGLRILGAIVRTRPRRRPAG